MKEIEMIELIGQIARKIVKRIGAAADKAGLSATESFALWHIFKTSGCKTSDIAAHLGLSPSTMTGMLDRLEAAGWVLREADPVDRRAVCIVATKKLTDFLKNAKRSVNKSLERTFSELPSDFMERLCADLALVLEKLETEEDQAR
jgi:DNA-binding MarR family transcriptional regulator